MTIRGLHATWHNRDIALLRANKLLCPHLFPLNKALCPPLFPWDLSARRLRTTLIGPAAGVTALAFSPDGRMVVAAGSGGDLQLNDLIAGREYTIAQGHGDGIWSAAFSPDGQSLATGGNDHCIRLWDVAKLIGADERREGTKQRIRMGSRPGPFLRRGLAGGKAPAFFHRDVVRIARACDLSRVFARAPITVCWLSNHETAGFWASAPGSTRHRAMAPFWSDASRRLSDQAAGFAEDARPLCRRWRGPPGCRGTRVLPSRAPIAPGRHQAGGGAKSG
jgi:WD domain, G-beta repeat